MRTLIALLLLTSTCHARLGVEVSLAIARARLGTNHSIVVQKPLLWFYTGDNCRHCVVADREIRGNEDIWKFVNDNYRWVVRKSVPGRIVPSWQVEGGNQYVGYRGLKHFYLWLKQENFTKREMR